ncbi:hypothetical protein GCM10020229_27510 [Kitasatospora albolonga]
MFGDSVGNVLPSVSRDVLKHGPSVAALRAASERFVEEIAAVVK